MDALNILSTGSLLSLTLDSTTLIYIFVVFFIIAAIIGISIVMNKTSTMSTPTNISRISGTQMTELETILAPYSKSKTALLSQQVPMNQRALVNFAPLTVMNPGYLGPLENGVYKENEAVSAALKAGARCFVLPIDYHENSGLPQPAFPAAGDPCLLQRDTGGVIRSLNAGSIQKVCESLANLAFNDVISLRTDPLVVVLYFVKTPQPNTKEYLRYCSKVAKELNPLIPFMLGQAPEGVYNRQARQDELLYTSLQNLERKIIIMNNIDTSIFRNPKSVGVQAVSQREDLDFMTHLRLFAQSDISLGATEKASQNQFPRGYVESFSFYSAIPDKRIKDTQDTNRIRWIVAIPTAIPSVKEIQTAIDSFGVQVVPLELYSFGEAEKPILDLWKASGWRLKPQNIRFTRPEPIQPKEPSPKLNANKGQLSSPTI
jgi:hypothetical protein